MLESIAQLFAPIVGLRNYPYHPRLRKRTHPDPHSTLVAADHYLLEDLAEPLEQWIVGREQSLESYFVMETLYRFIISQAAHAREVSCPPYRILLHNVFVLIAHFKVLDRIIERRVDQEIELLIDGMCGIYLKCKHQLTPSSLNELSCAIHYCLAPAFSLKTNNLRNFITVYQDIEEWSVDEVIGALLMLVELCKVMKDERIIVGIPYLGHIAVELLSFIQYHVEYLLYLHNCEHEDLSSYAEKLKGRCNVPVAMLLRGSLVSKKIMEKGRMLMEMEGFISPKVIYQYAYQQCLMIQALELQMRLLCLSPNHQLQEVRVIDKVLEAAHCYDFSLDPRSLAFIREMLRLLCVRIKPFQIKYTSFPDDICHRAEQCVFTRQISSWEVGEFMREAERSKEISSCELLDFTLERTPSILYYLLHMVYALKLEYLIHLEIIIDMHPNLQGYFLKNKLLHFLMHQFATCCDITSTHFNIIAGLLRNNAIAHRLLDELIRKQIQEHRESLIATSIKANTGLAMRLIGQLVFHSHLRFSLLAILLQRNIIKDIYDGFQASESQSSSNNNRITLILSLHMLGARRDEMEHIVTPLYVPLYTPLYVSSHQEWELFCSQVLLKHSLESFRQQYGHNVDLPTLRQINKNILKRLKQFE